MPAIEELNTILDYQILPWLEMDGKNRLAVAAPTLRQFRQQNLPEQIRTAVKKRTGKSIHLNGPRLYNNVCTVVEHWPEEDLNVTRHPSLKVVLHGQADFRWADYAVYAPAGHFLLSRPGTPGSGGRLPHLIEEQNRNQECEVLQIALLPGACHLNIWKCTSKKNEHSSTGYFSFLNEPQLTNTFHYFVREAYSNDKEARRICVLTLRLFFYLLKRYIAEYKDSEPAIPVLSPVDTAKNYINQHLNHKLTSDAVAKIVYLSRTHFLYRFRQETGKTFNDYVIARKLVESKRLLVSTNMSINTVADNIGLSRSHLWKIFKDDTGYTPQQYREKFQTKNDSLAQNRR